MRNFLRQLATFNKRYPESSKDEKTWVNFNGVNYMRHNSATREVNNSIYLNRYETRKYVI